MKRNFRHTILVLTLVIVFAAAISAQTTEITYQGQLQSSSAPANGIYDFEFLLFDALSGGTQIGSTLTRSGVAVANGIFSVKLDFGANFPGANRFLEIHVIQTGGGAFTPLTPRQAVSSAPYSVKSLNTDTATNAANATNAVNATNATTAATATNALSLGGVAASQYLQTNGNGSSLTNLNADNIATGTLSNARLGVVPIANGGTGSATQNFVDLTNAQTIGGAKTFSNTLSGNIVNSATQYNIGGNRVLSAENLNIFAGQAAGIVNTGISNSFFGVQAGIGNTTGSANSFFGRLAGENSTGNNNTFVGAVAGGFNTTGANNTIIGTNADVGANNLNFATALGSGASVGSSNTIVLGRSADTVQVPGALTVTGATTFAGTLGANIFNAVTQYNIGGSRVLSIGGASNFFAGVSTGLNNTTGSSNSFVGANAGLNNMTGSFNSFVGSQAGQNNTTGGSNSFFGLQAGLNNTTGNFNSFVGTQAGFFNTTGVSNSFFGHAAGLSNTTGVDNSFFGRFAGNSNTTGGGNSFFGLSSGFANTTGASNSFFGRSAGFANTTGVSNSFFGHDAGQTNTTGLGNSFFGRNVGFSNTTGSNNTIIGNNADVDSGNLTFATAVGAGAVVSTSNAVVLGRTTDFVGIGTTAPTAKLTVAGSGAFNASSAARFDLFNSVAAVGYLQHVTDAGLWQLGTADGQTKVVVASSGNVGIANAAPTQTLDVNGRARVRSIPVFASIASVCFNGAGDLLQCGASSLKWKTNIQSYRSGLDVIQHLRPISFNWKEDGRPDIGLGAEDVAKVAPSFAYTNSKGEVEGVKYERLNILLINAVNEQQAQIEELQKQNANLSETIKRQQTDFAALKQVVCSQNPRVGMCKPKN